MSIEVMSQVMLRYHAGGGERLVALALADNASSDGQRIFPTVDGIAHRAFLSTRSVQRHLRSMVASGWLILVRANSGRQGDTNHYRISPEWLAGGACVAPQAAVRRQPKPRQKDVTGDILSPVKSVDNSAPDPDGRVTPEVLTGDTGVTQTINNHQNTNTPLTPLPALDCGQPGPESGQPDSRTAGLAVMKPGGRSLPSWVFRNKRWKGSREQIEKVGELLGIGKWDRQAYEKSRIEAPPDPAHAALSFSAYQVMVLQLVAQAKGASRG